MALIYNATFDKNTRKLSFEDRAGNEVYSFTVPERGPAVDDITKPLTFRATQDGSTVSLKKNGFPSDAFQTSRDGGNTWTDYTIDTAIALNTGDEVSFRAKSDRTSEQASNSNFYFSMKGKIEAWHNVMSLYRTNDFATYNTVLGYAFFQMFRFCTSLTKAPALPATTLAGSCYEDMFFDCRSLTKAPELPSTALANNCYNGMFYDCTALAEAPELPSTTLAEGCYQYMFSGCTALAEAPALPATSLANICYKGMFYGCTALAKAPELPSTTLANNCYESMFNGCSSLNEVRCKISSSYSSSDIPTYTSNWLSNVSPTGTFYTNADANWSTGASGIPEGWNRVNESAPSVDDITKPLTFKATQDGSTVSLSKSGSPIGDFQTSRDGGNTWSDYTIDTAIALNTGDEVSFRAKADRTTGQSEQDYDNYFYFMMEGKIEAWHNVMSLYRTNDFATYESVVQYAFYNMFNGCTSLVKAPALPATTFASNCYRSMFQGCTSLVNAPALPVTTLASSCYKDMFNGCTSLTEAPALPATTLNPTCYSDMFHGCTSLVNAPALPATTLANNCYSSMFNGCTSLTEAPALPATTLAQNCYTSMFKGCTSLTKAPVLPATTLTEYCYYDMFNGCTSLTQAPELPATTLTEYCYYDMFYGCTSLVNAPVLPATTLANDCYEYMFDGCTSLTEAPALPATTLIYSCYYYMFNGCTSLTKAPELTATTLADFCYQYMFNGCSSLNEVRCKIPSSYSSSQISSYAANWLSGVSSTGTFYTNADANWTSGASGIPTGWTRLNEETPAVDDITKPLTFRATQDGSTVKLTKKNSPSGAFQTSRDGGNTWTDYTIDTAITLNIGDEVSFRAKADRTTAQSNSNYFYFMMEGRIEALHNVMSMLRTNDFATYESVVNYAFKSLFHGCTSLTKAPVLPATTLASNCYGSMFSGCTSLTEAPALPATTLIDSCYYGMFNGCTSLTKAPELPVTTLADNCYQLMFKGCTSLTKAPVLPATTLADYCYSNMFSGCTSLTEAPALPATTISRAKYCYSGMFYSCTSLTKAPELPATILSGNYYDGVFQASHCYDSMFMGCTSLTEAPALPATTLALYCYSGMFRDCTSLTEAPELPATTLAEDCYSQMFYNCTSLTKAPALPATTLASNCYDSIFSGCTSLTKAPALPATTLANNCYENMFYGCTSLTEAPALSATTLVGSCYWSMFYGCSSLNKVRCKMPSTISEGDISSYTYHWLEMVSSTGTFYTNADANWSTGSASGIPEGWRRLNIDEEAPAVDNIRKPLTFRATQDGSTVKLTKNGSPDGAFQTSRDGGNTWTDYTLGTYITLNTGDEVSFRAKADRTSAQTMQDYFDFQMTGKIEAWHNVMSMYRKDDFATYSHIVSHAFNSMFNGCTSLTKAPKLPVTTLAHSCYRKMFEGCTSLTKPPALPATTLAVACYWDMFDGCTSLTKAPELPATALASSCYHYMFYGCTSLTKTPALSATTLAEDCYQEMFRNCSSLNEVRCKIPSSYSSSAISSYAYYWLSGVSSKGTFYTNSDANWPSGDDGIPQTWTRANIDDYPTT